MILYTNDTNSTKGTSDLGFPFVEFGKFVYRDLWIEGDDLLFISTG
jgi:hypothetical protein